MAIWNREGYCFKFVWCVHTRGDEQLAGRGNAGHLFKVGDNSGTMAAEKKKGADERDGGAVKARLRGRGGQRGKTGRRRSRAAVSRIKRHAEKLEKIQLECGVKTGFEVGHGA